MTEEEEEEPEQRILILAQTAALLQGASCVYIWTVSKEYELGNRHSHTKRVFEMLFSGEKVILL
jgi:hypothetical protein